VAAPVGREEEAAKSWTLPGTEDGRGMSINLQWGGHKLIVGCVYLPNEAVESGR